jgi:predicted PurR-regulated permease PerM
LGGDIIAEKEWLDRSKLQTLVFIALTAGVLYLCYLIVLPFISPLIWALALAVLANPVYRSIAGFLKNKTVAASLMTLAVAVGIVVPVYLISQELSREVWRSAEYVRGELDNGQWRAQVEQNSYSRNALKWIESEVDLRGAAEQAANYIPGVVSGFLAGSIWAVFQLLLIFFALFFFFRDHDLFLRGVRRIIPLDRRETDILFERVKDTLYATVFGEILIAVGQGVLGGFIFWMLGIPAPILWGFVMAIFALVPAIGTWIIWMPTAIFLMLQGEWGKGIVLIVWGVVVLTILNYLLYSALVSNRLHLHTLLVFIAIFGGILTFGAVGIILGPLALAVAVSLLEIWRRRTTRITVKA